MLDFTASRALPLVFLKAVQKKQIYVPAFVKANGESVKGHMKWVHVADDHSDEKVASGQGSHSQKVAHGKLAKHEWFHALPTGDKSALVLAHATDHQAMDSANARASTLRSKILKGEKPIPGEWRAWGYVEDDKRQKLYEEITAAGKGAFFQSCMNVDEVKKGVEARKERLEHQPADAADVKEAEQPKEEPKAEEKQPEPAAEAPKAEEPKPEPKAEPAPAAAEEKPAEPKPQAAPAGKVSAEHQAVLDAIQAKMLPADAKNAYANLKYQLIKQAFEAGDAKALLAMTYGTNTYGKYAAKLANMALTALGHEHQVAPGQKAGTHPALAGDLTPKQAAAAPEAKQEPKDEPKPAEPAPAPQAAESAQPEKAEAAAAAEPTADAVKPGQKLPMPEFADDNEVKNSKIHYGMVASKVINAAAAGKLATLKKLMDADTGNTWKGKTANSKMLLALYADAMKQAQGILPEVPAVIHYGVYGQQAAAMLEAAQKGDWSAAEGIADEHKGKPEFSTYSKELLAHKPEAAAEQPAEPVAEAPAAGALAMPEFEEGKDIKGVKSYYEDKAQKIMDLAAAGDAAGLEKLKEDGLKPNSKGKVGNTFKGKTVNSKKLLELHAAALAQAKGQDAPQAAPAAAVDAGPKEGDTKPAADGGTLVLHNGHWIKQEEADLAAAVNKNGFSAKVHSGKGVLLAGSDGSAKVYANKTQAENAVEKLGEVGFDAHVIGQHPFLVKIDGKSAPAAPGNNDWLEAGTKDYEPEAKPAEKSPKDFLLDAENDAAFKLNLKGHGMVAHVNAAAKQWLDANPQKLEELNAALDALGYSKLPDPAAAAAAPAVLTDAEIGTKPASVNSFHFNEAKLHAKNGDLAKLQEQHKKADDAGFPNTANHIAGMVAALQAKQGVSAAPAAEAAPAKQAATEEVERAAKTMGKKMAEDGEIADLADLIQTTKGVVSEKVHQYLQGLLAGAKEKLAAEAAPAAAAVPVPPDTSGMTQTKQNCVEEIQQAFNAKDVWQLEKQVMNLKGLDSFAPVYKYGEECLAHLKNELGLNFGIFDSLKNDVDVAVADGDKAALDGIKDYLSTPQNTGEPGAKEMLAYIAKKEGAAPAAPAADTGPKDGDTKQGADGMLVFQNGRWHKMGDDPKVLAAKANSVGMPKLTGTASIKLTKLMKGLKEIAMAGGEKGLKLAIKDLGTQLKVQAGGYAFAFNKDLTGSGPNGKAAGKYIMELQAAMAGTKAAEPVAPKLKAASEKPGEAPSPLASSPAEKVSISGWTKTAGQKGYNEGGFYTSPDGQEWYCKFPAGGENVAKNELLANRLAALAGLNVPALQMITQAGKVGLASKIIPGAKEDKAGLLAGKAKGLLESFAAHAWLANWDAVGNNPSKGFDNILIDDKGVAHHIDQGGALTYGGAGGKKSDFSDKVIELKTMLDASKNANTAAVFGKMSPIDIAASVAKIITISDQQIQNFVAAYGPGDAAEKAALAAKLIARKNDMAAQYPQAVEIAKKMGKKAGEPAQEKPKLDPTNLPVTIEKLPVPHDFMNWQGSGKPISDKPYVAFNMKAEADIIAAAMKGDLVALQNYKYMAVEQTTGKELGLKSITEHPSKHVKEFWESCVNHLDAIANPPEPLKVWDGIQSESIKELSDAFPPKLFGVSASKVPANEKLGFWIALGVNTDVSKFKPKVTKHAYLLTDLKQKGFALYQGYKKIVKQFISAVQGSGSANNPYREGKEIDASGNSTREVLRELYKCAQVKPEGTTITKWIDFYPGMIDQFEGNPEGLVFQNPGSMCCSMHPTGTKDKGFGHHRVTIHFAEGARACDTFGSGGFSSEMEITTLPGARFMVLNKGWGVDGDKSRYNLEVLMLPPDQTYVDAI